MRLEALPARDKPGHADPAVAPTLAGHALPPDGNGSPPERAATRVAETHRAADLIDRFLRDSGRQFSFSVDDITGKTVVSIRDAKSGELIRQLPSEEALRIARNLALEAPRLVSERA